MKELMIREAIPDDAKELLNVLKQIGGESEFLTMDENGIDISVEAEQIELARIYESENNTLLLAIVDGKIAGTISVHADFHFRVAHIGEIGISILKKYQGFGIGKYLMAAMIEWAEESQVIRRLELTVQKRNAVAVGLYQKYGFEIEAEKARGARLKSGEFITVLSMSRLVD